LEYCRLMKELNLISGIRMIIR